jgi:hypothetical protein
MHKSLSSSLVAALPLALAACAAPRPEPAAPVVIHYQHVANAHEVRFSAPLALSQRTSAWVVPRQRQGFWAIFVLCSMNVRSDLPRFYYDVNNFRIDYPGRDDGPLRPFSLRYDDTPDLNGPADTPALASAIAGELQYGPSQQVFGPGAYPALDYRIVLFVPRGLDDYAGDQLALRYHGQRVLLLGNGYPPFNIPAVGGTGAGMASHCLP